MNVHRITLKNKGRGFKMSNELLTTLTAIAFVLLNFLPIFLLVFFRKELTRLETVLFTMAWLTITFVMIVR